MRLVTLILCLLFALGSVAQDCNAYFLLQNNKKIEMMIYNKKGKSAGKQVYKVSDLVTNSGVTTAKVVSEMFDDKDKLIATGENEIRCTGGVMMMNMKMLIPQQQQQHGIQTADVSAESVFLEYPSTINVGDELKEGNFNMDMDMNGMKQQMTMAITNRKVNGKESVTTPAGTWECYKIDYKSKMSIKTLGIGIPINMTGTEWIAPGFGIVKTVNNYGGTEITAIN